MEPKIIPITTPIKITATQWTFNAESNPSIAISVPPYKIPVGRISENTFTNSILTMIGNTTDTIAKMI